MFRYNVFLKFFESFSYIKIFFNLYFLLFVFIGVSQEKDDLKIKNTLKKKSYKELTNLSNGAFQNRDTLLLNIYREYHLKKAKLEHNKLEIARAYYYYITWNNLKQDLLYCDSIINITENSNHLAYPTTGYLLKANLFYNESNFQKALDNFIWANELSETKNDEEGKLESILGIAAIQNIWGLEKEALTIYKTYYKKIVSLKDYEKKHYSDYVLLSTNLSLSYIRNNKPDSALVISEKAMRIVKDNNDEPSYYDLGKVHANANFYLKKYPQTLDSLDKFLPNYSGLLLSDSYYMMAKIAQFKNEYLLSITYFKKMDSIHRVINDPFPELKEAYNELFKYAKSEGNKDDQIYYVSKLIEADSVLDINYEGINDKVRSDYDIPKFKKEKKHLENKISSKNQHLVLSIIGALVLIMVIIFLSLKRQKILKQRLQKLLNTDVIDSHELNIKASKSKTVDISKNIVNDILNKLGQFEDDKGYLSKDVTLNLLAKEFKTNSSYLSVVINHEKQVNFSTYLRSLRIINAINSLKTDNEYLKYSINGIADKFGFSTAESFSKAFRKKTGIKPSYFLYELRKKRGEE